MEILLFIFFLLVFIGMLIGGYVIKSIKNFKKAVEQAADRREQQFRSETGRQNQQYSQRSTRNTQRTQQYRHTEKAQNFQQKTQYTQGEARQTQTATGETIIDQHHQKRENRKIFDDEEGEYVEFTEEK